MKNLSENILIDCEKCVLSSESHIFKTEQFIRATHLIADVDGFIAKIAEGLIFAMPLFRDFIENHENTSFCVETQDNFFTLFFRFGYSITNNTEISPKDIVFYRFETAIKLERKRDLRLTNYLARNKRFSVKCKNVIDESCENDFSKLYVLSNDDKINFPVLNSDQKRIVELEDKNVLVQGVAGSGKTNICIEKIIFCACRNYFGKVLYTTFSRGLLIETKNRIELIRQNLRKFVDLYNRGNVIFTDKNHKKAIENKLGIYFTSDDDNNIMDKIRRVISYLTEKVDYCLLEDLYSAYIDKPYLLANESYFINNYIGDLRSFRLFGTLEKIKYLSLEIIYKEIFGMIYGKYEISSPENMMTREEYYAERQGSFSRIECDAIYTLALDYAKNLDKNGYIDNNFISRAILSSGKNAINYSLAVIDEVQDFTEVNLAMIKTLSRKMFCVGDALQMINPSYFGFAYLKRLMYDKEITAVAELKHNYRSSENIEKIIENLSALNVKLFGTHNFVIKGKSIKSDLPTATVFVNETNLIELIAKENFENITVIVSNLKRKEELRKKLKKTEILTVSEAKGLERNTVILDNVLSDNVDKWHALSKITVNRKTADENSVYRYYFNLFYVGVSRAKQYLFVTENAKIPLFYELFDNAFESKSVNESLRLISTVADKIEIDDEELLERIKQFVNLEQYDNARFTVDKLSDDVIRTEELNRVNIAEKYIHFGKYREAGVEFWKCGMISDAKKMFVTSGDEKLYELVDACAGEKRTLDVDIVKFFPDVIENETATKIILDTVKNDFNSIMDKQKLILGKLNKRKA